MIVACSRSDGAAANCEIARVTVALQHLWVGDDSWARMDLAHLDAYRRLWIDVTRRAQTGYVAAPACLLALAAWQSGHGAMQARPTAMGSNSTVLRSGRQGPPLPDTVLPQAAGFNFSSNVPLEPNSTGYVENLVRLQAEAAADDLLNDLGGAADDRLHAAELPELTIVPENSGVVLRRSRPGFL